MMVGYQRHVNPAYVETRDAVLDGEIAPKIVTAELTQDWIQNVAGTWRVDPDMSGGGQLYDSGSHLLDAIIWLIDEVPTRVTADMEYVDEAQRVDVQAVLTVRFADDTVASIAVSGDAPDISERITVPGTADMRSSREPAGVPEKRQFAPPTGRSGPRPLGTSRRTTKSTRSSSPSEMARRHQRPRRTRSTRRRSPRPPTSQRGLASPWPSRRTSRRRSSRRRNSSPSSAQTQGDLFARDDWGRDVLRFFPVDDRVTRLTVEHVDTRLRELEADPCAFFDVDLALRLDVRLDAADVRDDVVDVSLGLDDLNDARDRMPTGRVREFDVLRTDPENYLFCPATSAACPSERG